MNSTNEFPTLFEQNLLASQLIMSGDSESATSILSKFSADDLHTSMHACKSLLSTEGMLSISQTLCLRQKLEIMQTLLRAI